jgi:hypothetical protein
METRKGTKKGTRKAKWTKAEKMNYETGLKAAEFMKEIAGINIYVLTPEESRRLCPYKKVKRDA